MNSFSHRMRYLGTCRIQGIIDVKPDHDAVILQGRHASGINYVIRMLSHQFR